MQKVHIPNERDVLLKKEIQLLEKEKNIVKENRKRKRIKSQRERKKQEHENDQKDEESKRRTEEEKRKAYLEEELRIEKELNEKEEESEEKENEHEDNEDEDQEEEDILRGDVFQMPPRFPIPEPSAEIPPLPIGCSILDNTASCIDTKLTQIPPIMDAELTTIEFVGNSITSIPDDAFNGIPNLERIDLRKNNITSSGIGQQAFKVRKLTIFKL
ncbi:UNVERIFIED_CONTAM: hypothetical protein K2H54_045364 [Gekko kuhli]